jgi:hypothetical protein
MIKFSVLLIFIVSDIKAIDNSICSNRGNRLKNTTDCVCADGYVTFPKESKYKCNYEIKSEKIAVFLSFFAGILGADMYYLGYNTRGFLKLLIPIFLISIALYYKTKIQNEKLQLLSLLLPVALLITTWIYDILRISAGNFMDANNISISK